MRLRVRTCIAAAIAGLAVAAPVAAQRISGIVRETDGGALIPGAFISLLDGSGTPVRADFTTAEGAFSLEAPAPGSYRLRLQRIGYATWETEAYALEAGSPRSVTVEVPPRPIRLRDLRVEVNAACVDDPSQEAALTTVWDELRKALETAVWAEGRGELRFTFTRWARILEPRTLAVREVTSRTYRRRPLPPFESLPASELVTYGFVVLVADSSEYRAPDANALLSRAFRTAHCFGLRRATAGGVSKLGLTFRPRERRPVVQIEGTLWLDEETAALDRVQLSYLNPPVRGRVDRRLIGAEIVFGRIPDGPFYVRDWWIRFPLYEEGSFTGYKQGGGSARRASGGGESWRFGRGVAAGVVRDSVTREPLAGADVVFREWEDAVAFLPLPDPLETPFSTRTDGEGRFLVAGLPEGDYALSVDHPRLRTAGVRPSERRVVVNPLDSTELEAWTPSAETLYVRICPDAAADAGVGAVVGVARNAATGAPIPGVDVEVSWRVRLGPGAARGVYASATADGRGRFAVCAVPLGEPVRLRAGAGGVGDAVEFSLDASVAWHDVPVAPAAPGSGPPSPQR